MERHLADSRGRHLEFFLGADDRALLTIDGVAMVERSPTLDMSTASATRALDAGPHTIQLDYEQHRGASRLNLQVASDGRTPGPLDPYSLFPTEPTAASVRVGLAAKVSQRAAFIVWSAFGVILVGIAGHRVLALVQAPPRSWSRITSRAHSFFDSVRTISPMVCAGVALSIVAYATLLRIDAITTRYGPLEQPRWAQALQNASDRFETWQPALGWRPVDHPYVGGDPINYIRFAKEMESFYGAHVREPVFPLVTKVWLWLLDQQDIAVSFASALFSVLGVWATWLLGSYVFSQWVGLGAAFAMAIERDVISWGVSGWRDDAFTFGVVLSTYALVRYRDTTYHTAVAAGLFGGLSCLTRITSLSFLLAGYGVLAIVYRADRARRRLLALAVLTMTVVTAPYLLNCWWQFGDQFYAINNHTEFYQSRQGMSPQSDLSAKRYIGAMVAEDPLRMVEVFAVGMTTYPFANKWRGFEPWWPGLGRWLSWSAVVGLGLMLRSSDGRFLLIVLAASLLPYAFTWEIWGGAEWRFTQHAYPFYLVAAFWMPVYLVRVCVESVNRRTRAASS